MSVFFIARAWLEVLMVGAALPWLSHPFAQQPSLSALNPQPVFLQSDFTVSGICSWLILRCLAHSESLPAPPGTYIKRSYQLL